MTGANTYNRKMKISKILLGAAKESDAKKHDAFMPFGSISQFCNEKSLTFQQSCEARQYLTNNIFSYNIDIPAILALDQAVELINNKSLSTMLLLLASEIAKSEGK